MTKKGKPLPEDLPPPKTGEYRPEDFDHLSTAEIEELLGKVAKSAETNKKIFPIAFYHPNPPQDRLTRLIANSVEWQPDGTVRQRQNKFGAFWANRTGKTAWWCNFVYNCAQGTELRWWRHRLYQEWPFPKSFRLICNAKQLKEVTGAIDQAIRMWWPAHEFKAYKQGYDYNSRYDFLKDGKPTGAFMDVATLDQPASLHESVNLGCAIFDEPPPHDIFHAYSARLDKGGIRIICGTLIEESAWIAEEMMDDPKCGWFHADIFENCKCCHPGTNGAPKGHLEHHVIQQMVDDFPDEVREARKTGKPIHLRAQVFALDETIHVVPREDVPGGTNYLVVDPHPARPWAIIVGTVDALGDYYVVDEWPRLEDFGGKPYHRIDTDRRGLEDYARIIKELCDKWNVSECIIDGKFANTPIRSYQSSTTLRDQLLMAGLYFADGNPNIEGDGGGLRKLQTLLKFDATKEIGFNNRPRFYIASDLTNCRTQMKNIRRKKDPSPDRFIYRDALEEKYLDFPRCLMYFVMHRAGYNALEAGDPEKEMQQRIKESVEKQDAFANV